MPRNQLLKSVLKLYRNMSETDVQKTATVTAGETANQPINIMSNFSFKALNIHVRANCASPVAASVRKSEAKWINIRILKEVVDKASFKPGEIVSTFIDEPNRALLFVTGQRPMPPGSRKIYGKDGSSFFDLPRQGVLAEWFPQSPIRGMILVEASHGRIVIQVPKV